MTLGDDDWVGPGVFTHAAFLDDNPSCSACAGLMAAVPPLSCGGMTCFDDRFMNSDPIDRAIDYIRYSLWEQDVNWLALAMHRRSTMLMYIDYFKIHPFQFHFRDQMLSQIALLTGTVKGLREGFMCYATRTPEEMAIHKERHSQSLQQLGLPPWLHHYYPYWLACEYATLYLWRGLPDSVFADRIRDADRVFNELFARFRENYDRNTSAFEDHFEQAGIWKPMYDVLDHPSAIVGLRSLSTIFSTVNADAGARFSGFLKTEMVADIVSTMKN